MQCVRFTDKVAWWSEDRETAWAEAVALEDLEPGLVFTQTGGIAGYVPEAAAKGETVKVQIKGITSGTVASIDTRRTVYANALDAEVIGDVLDADEIG